MRHPTAVDLFAGAGGATTGFVSAGFRVIAAVELDKSAAETYALNHENTRLYREDIANLDAWEVRRQLENSGALQGQLDLLNACPPCQGFSTRGIGRKDDIRNDLVLCVEQWVRAFQPRTIVIENVPGLRHNERLYRLIRGISAVGYGSRQYLCDATDFGVPQRRRRLICLFVQGRSSDQFPEDLRMELPEHFDTSRQTAGEWLSLAGAGGKDDRWHRARTLRPATLERVQSIPRGGNRFDIPKHLWLPCHLKLEGAGRGAAAESYGRIDPDAPAPTMTTRCTTVSSGTFIHPEEDRGITLREAALLQTFPRTYQFAGKYGSVERQIGNAFPVKFAAGIGLAALSLSEFTPEPTGLRSL